MSYFDFYGAAKPYLRSYVETITERSRRAGSGMYKCPLCGSGEGPKGTGAFSLWENGTRYRCFSCGASGDIWELVKAYTGKEREEAAEYLAGLFPGIRSGQLPKDYDPKKETSAGPAKPNTPGLFRSVIETAAGNAGKTEYWKMRGFTPETVARFRLGFVDFSAVFSGPCVIIPYGPDDSYFMARSVNGKAFYKPKSDEAGPEPVFNASALYHIDGTTGKGRPCFICEAPIDAVSVCQAGGLAVATGGTSHGNVIRQIKRKRPAAPIILCMDPDGPGEKAAADLAAELAALAVPFIKADFARETYPHGETLKDPNDLLRADPVHFAADVKRIEENARNAKAPGAGPDPFTPAEAGALDPSGDPGTEPATMDPEALPLAQKVYRASDYLITGEYDVNVAYFSAYKDRKTGFDNIDKYLTLYPGLCALGGAASLGKTTLAVNLAENLARAGETVLYFALEQEPVELISKIIARNLYQRHPETVLTNIDIKNGAKSPELYEVRAELIDVLKNLYFINEDFLTTVDTVSDAVRSFIERTGKKPAVFLDYLQLLSPSENDPAKDTRSNTDYNLKALKSLQRENELLIMVISNFNRSSYKDPVSYEAFKESGMIEYTCDYVFGLQLAVMEDPAYWRRTSQKNGRLTTTGTDENEKSERIKEEQRRSPKLVELVSLKNRNGRQSWRAYFDYYPQFDYYAPNAAGKYTRAIPAPLPAGSGTPTAADVFKAPLASAPDPEAEAIADERAEAARILKEKKAKGTKKA